MAALHGSIPDRLKDLEQISLTAAMRENGAETLLHGESASFELQLPECRARRQSIYPEQSEDYDYDHDDSDYIKDVVAHAL
jgi:hypothetical protein